MRLTASFLQHARKKISFPKIPTRRTLSVTNVTSFVFIFFMSDIRNADTFDRVFRRPAELAFRRNGDTLSRLGVAVAGRAVFSPTQTAVGFPRLARLAQNEERRCTGSPKGSTETLLLGHDFSTENDGRADARGPRTHIPSP
jgi:hypothetical protein